MSKILLLSAGTRPESKNNKAASIVNSYLSELEIPCNLYDDFYENVPFLRDYNDEQPEYVIKVRDDLIETSKIITSKELILSLKPSSTFNSDPCTSSLIKLLVCSFNSSGSS